MRDDAEESRAPFWLPDALHATLMALLARIFGRLEDMIRLWQAGLLPPPALRSLAKPSERPPTTSPAYHPAVSPRARNTQRNRAERAGPCSQEHHARKRANRERTAPSHDQPGTPSRPTEPCRCARAPPPGAPIRAAKPLNGAANPRLNHYEYVIKRNHECPLAAAGSRGTKMSILAIKHHSLLHLG